MTERLADAIDELAQPNRRERQEDPQIQADPALRRPRLLRVTPAPVVAVIVLAAAVAAGWAMFWVLGLPIVSDRLGSLPGHLAVRIAAAVVIAVVVGGLIAWIFRPAQTLRRVLRTWGTASRRRTTRIPLFAAVVVAIVAGLGLAALATWAIGGSVFYRATTATAMDVVNAALPAIVGVLVVVAVLLAYRRQKDSERAQFAQRFGVATAQLGDPDVAVRVVGV